MSMVGPIYRGIAVPMTPAMLASYQAEDWKALGRDVLAIINRLGASHSWEDSGPDTTLGVYWSRSKDVARSFGGRTNPPHSLHVVVSARYDDQAPSGERIGYGWGGRDEQEQTLGPDTPMEIISVECEHIATVARDVPGYPWKALDHTITWPVLYSGSVRTHAGLMAQASSYLVEVTFGTRNPEGVHPHLNIDAGKRYVWVEVPHANADGSLRSNFEMDTEAKLLATQMVDAGGVAPYRPKNTNDVQPNPITYTGDMPTKVEIIKMVAGLSYTGMEVTAGPGGGKIPRAFRALTIPVGRALRSPRKVVLDRPALKDLTKVPPDLRDDVEDALHNVEEGKAYLEAKVRELAGAFGVRITNSWRALFYLGVDTLWHCFAIVDHDYYEAERRFASLQVEGSAIEYKMRPGRGAVVVVEALDGDYPVGKMEIATESLPDDYPQGMIRWVSVMPSHQRQGIARQMLEYARAHLPYPVIHSRWQTPDGQAFEQHTGSLPLRIQPAEGDHSTEWTTVWAFVGPQQVGYLSWEKATGQITQAFIRPEDQRKGYGTEMLRLAREQDPRLHHNTDLTDAGRAWSEKVAGAKGDLPEGLTFIDGGPDVLPDAFPFTPARYAEHEIRAVLDGRIVGQIKWLTQVNPVAGITPGHISFAGVAGDLQRRGIASEMLARARKIDPSVHHSRNLTDDGQAWSGRMGAWRPDGGMFKRGQDTLDPRVFDLATEQMLPGVRTSVIDALDGYWTPLYGDWKAWAKVYLAGSGASYWWDSDADMDILIGVDLDHLRLVRPANREVSDEEILAHLNKGLRTELRPMTKTLNGFETTFFVNENSYDIRQIQPYAAYDMTADAWVVHPPVLDVSWSAHDLPDSTWRRVDQAITEAEAVLALPEPARTSAGIAMFNWVHEGRRVAYTPGGQGWLDPGNVIYQALTQHPDALLRRLYLCKHPEEAVAAPPKTAASNNIDQWFPMGHVDDFASGPWSTDGIWPRMDEGFWKDQPVREFDPASLRATQNHIYKRHLDRYTKHPDAAPDGGDLAWVLRYKGQDWLVDGHHRAAEAVTRGAKIRAHFFELGSTKTAANWMRAFSGDGKTHYAYNKPYIGMVIDGPIGSPMELQDVKVEVPWEGDLPHAIEQVVAKTKHVLTTDEFWARNVKMKDPTVYLIAGSGEKSLVLGTAKAKSIGTRWGAPVKAEYRETWPGFLDKIHRDPKKAWVEYCEVIGDAQPPGFDSHPALKGQPEHQVTIYRGITLMPGQDPATAINTERGGHGMGSSWTLDEKSAKAIAERGGAGFGADNGGGKKQKVPARPSSRPTVPVVIRAQVDLNAPGIALFTDGRMYYASEQEVNVDAGTEIKVTGYAKAEAVPESAAAKAKAEEVAKTDPYSDEASYWITYRWGSYSGGGKRTAMRDDCGCCGGAGEHRCGHECYACDASGASSKGSGFCDGHNGRPDEDRGPDYGGTPENGMQHVAAGDLVLYHGTRAENVEAIRESGLTPPPGVNPAGWPMLTTSREQAARYAPYEDAVVLEYRIPAALTNYRNEGALLWPGDEHDVYDFSATAYGIKAPLPAKYLVAVHPARSHTAARDEDFLKSLRWAQGPIRKVPGIPYQHMIQVTTQDREKVGFIRWMTKEWRKAPAGEVLHIQVYPPYQRRGVATELFNKARRLDPRVHHSTTQTDDGAAWAQHAAGINGVLPEGLTFEHHWVGQGWEAAVVAEAYIGKQKVGELGWYEDGGEIAMVSVIPQYRRRGIASALLTYARSVDPKVHHSDVLSADGTQWRKNVAAGLAGDLPQGLLLHYVDGFSNPTVQAYVPRPGKDRVEPAQGNVLPAGRLIGFVEWFGRDKKVDGVPHKAGEVNWLYVDDEYRRRGVAEALWDFAMKSPSPVKPVHSLVRSDDGDAFARSVTPGVTPRTHDYRGGEVVKIAGQAGGLPADLSLRDVGIKHEGEDQTHRVEAWVGTKYAGSIQWFTTETDKHWLGEIATVMVFPEFQRRGIASALLKRAREIEPRVRHSRSVTDAGAEWAIMVGSKQATFFMHDVNEPLVDAKPMSGFEDKASFDFVTDQIATGGALRYASDMRILARRGVTGIVSGRRDFDDALLLKDQPDLKIDTLYLPSPDDGNPKPVSWFKAAIDFCLPKLRRGEKVYLHCHAGMNRGPSLAYAVVRAYTGMDHNAAMKAIKGARSVALVGYAKDADAALVELGYAKAHADTNDIAPFHTLTGSKTAATKTIYRGINVATFGKDLSGSAAIERYVLASALAGNGSTSLGNPLRGAGLGQHWTTNIQVARNFSDPMARYAEEKRARPDGYGAYNIPVVVTATVADTDVVTNEQELRDAMVEGIGWTGLPSATRLPEDEVLVKDNAPIHVLSVEAAWPTGRWSSTLKGPQDWKRIGGGMQAAAAFGDPWGPHLWGKGMAAMFGTGEDTNPIGLIPFRQAGRSRNDKPLTVDMVRAALSDPGKHLDHFDPRVLKSDGGQAHVTRAGVDYYMGDQYALTGRTYADQAQAGNRYPVVYVRQNGDQVLMTGRHRATAALLKGEMLQALRIEEPRAEEPHRHAALDRGLDALDPGDEGERPRARRVPDALGPRRGRALVRAGARDAEGAGGQHGDGSRPRALRADRLGAAQHLTTTARAEWEYTTYNVPDHWDGPLYRGLVLNHVPDDLYEKVAAKKGYDVRGQIAKPLWEYLTAHSRGLGVHWATEENYARHFAQAASNGSGLGKQICVIVQIHPVDGKHFERDPRALGEGGFQSHLAEREIALRPGTPIALDGLQWWDPTNFYGVNGSFGPGVNGIHYQASLTTATLGSVRDTDLGTYPKPVQDLVRGMESEPAGREMVERVFRSLAGPNAAPVAVLDNLSLAQYLTSKDWTWADVLKRET